MIPANLSLKQISIFVKIVECGGLTEAANKINLTPSAVSKNLMQLEDILGMKLIRRTTRNVFPTEEGRILYESFCSLLSGLESTIDTISKNKIEPEGSIRVTCPIALGASQIIHIFSEYKKIYPKVNLQIELSDEKVNLNEDGYDVALRITNEIKGNYFYRELSPIQWVFCASPNYLCERGVPKNIEDLKSHDGLIYPNLNEGLKLKDEFNENVSLSFKKVVVKANSSLVLIDAVLKDLGVSFLPSYLISKYIYNDEIVPVVIEGDFSSKVLYSVCLPERKNNLVIKSFLDFLDKWFYPTPPWDKWMLDDPYNNS